MLDTHNIYLILTLVFLLGISIGSFISLASYRLPRSEEIVFKSSYCPNCNARLGVLDLIPLASWLMQSGKCRHCHTSISARYPLIELTTGMVFVIIALYDGININFVLLALLATELAIMIVSDLEHYIIPDSIQVAVLATGIAYRLHNNDGIEDILTGTIAGLALGLALHYGYLHLRKKDALGFGDVKFLGAAGSWLPLVNFVPFLFLAGLAGIVTGLIWRTMGRGEVFPFGPALAFSLFINVFIPDIIQSLQRII